MASEPLPYLYDVHPEARAAHPVDVGLETIDVDDIAGTAVGGGAQRGGDFLPLKPFRGNNWHAPMAAPAELPTPSSRCSRRSTS